MEAHLVATQGAGRPSVVRQGRSRQVACPILFRRESCIIPHPNVLVRYFNSFHVVKGATGHRQARACIVVLFGKHLTLAWRTWDLAQMLAPTVNVLSRVRHIKGVHVAIGNNLRSELEESIIVEVVTDLKNAGVCTGHLQFVWLSFKLFGARD